MAVSTKTLNELVDLQVSAVKARSSKIVNTSVGSVFRALLEAVAGVVLWLQALILRVLSQSRASTATGAELDTWMADFSFVRLGASKAVGAATFSRSTTTPNSPRTVISSGATPATIKDPATGQSFIVTTDTSNAAYSSSEAGYVLAQGAASLSVPIQAADGGSAGNVTAGSITQLASNTSGVDLVTNAADLSGGRDKETDDALRSRFLKYLHSLHRGTIESIGYGITSIAADMDYKVVQNLSYNTATEAGTAQAGYFFVVADEGGGTLSTATQTKIQTIVEKYRPIGTTFNIYAPSTVTVAVTVTLTTTANPPANLATTVTAAIKTYLSSLKLGEDASYTGVAHSIYEASSEITNVTGLQLNSTTADVTINDKQVCLPGTITVN